MIEKNTKVNHDQYVQDESLEHKNVNRDIPSNRFIYSMAKTKCLKLL